MDGAAMDEQWLVRAGMLRACHVGMLGPAGRKRWTGKAMDEPSYGKSYVHESKSAMDGCETGQLWKGGLCADQLWTGAWNYGICEKARACCGRINHGRANHARPTMARHGSAWSGSNR